MSHFVANSISISKDFKTFKVKGGDNNVVPRSNYWSHDIPLNNLFDSFNGGGIRLVNKTEKGLFIDKLVTEESKTFFGDWNDETDYWHMKRKNPTNEKVVNFDKQFLAKLIEGLKNLSNKKEYIVRFDYNTPTYITTLKRSWCYETHDIENALKFSKYRAEYVAGKFKKYLAIPIKVK